jgi:tetratricopeptide (TPR) repeat protein
VAATDLRVYVAELAFTLGLYEQALDAMPDLIAASGRLLSQGIITPVTHAYRLALHGRMLAEANRPNEARVQLSAALPAMLTDSPIVRQSAGLLQWGCAVLALGDREQMPQIIDQTKKALARHGQAAPWNYDSPNAHRLLADLYLAANNPASALEHAQLALTVNGLRQHGIEGYYLTLARSQREMGRDAEAADAIRAAYQRVLTVAGRTPDPEAQAAWLERVPDNREIIAWWEGINAPDASTTTTAPHEAESVP